MIYKKLPVKFAVISPMLIIRQHYASASAVFSPLISRQRSASAVFSPLIIRQRSASASASTFAIFRTYHQGSMTMRDNMKPEREMNTISPFRLKSKLMHGKLITQGSVDIKQWEEVLLQYHREKLGHEGIICYKYHLYRNGYNSEKVLATVIQSATNIKKYRYGFQVLGIAVTAGYANDYEVQRSSFRLYLASNMMLEAQAVFDKMAKKEIGVWTDMICALEQKNKLDEMLLLFSRLVSFGSLIPDQRTLSVILAAVDILHGQILHTYMKKSGFMYTRAMNSLMSMYGRFGEVKNAFKVFEDIDVSRRDITTINSIMTAFLDCNMLLKVIELWEYLYDSNFKADDVTFVLVLTAFRDLQSYDGAVQVYNIIEIELGTRPNHKHTAIIVGLHGVFRYYDEAVNLIKEEEKHGREREELDAYWRDLSVKAEKNLDYKVAFEAHDNITNKTQADWIQLTNMYSTLGRFECAQKCRELMKAKNYKKEAAVSRIDATVKKEY